MSDEKKTFTKLLSCPIIFVPSRKGVVISMQGLLDGTSTVEELKKEKEKKAARALRESAGQRLFE